MFASFRESKDDQSKHTQEINPCFFQIMLAAINREISKGCLLEIFLTWRSPVVTFFRGKKKALSAASFAAERDKRQVVRVLGLEREWICGKRSPNNPHIAGYYFIP